jgi:hypothetical protein
VLKTFTNDLNFIRNRESLRTCFFQKGIVPWRNLAAFYDMTGVYLFLDFGAVALHSCITYVLLLQIWILTSWNFIRLSLCLTTVH